MSGAIAKVTIRGRVQGVGYAPAGFGPETGLGFADGGRGPKRECEADGDLAQQHSRCRNEPWCRDTGLSVDLPLQRCGHGRRRDDR